MGRVSPNPPVGAVLVYNDRILGEGYHTAYGAPHAEVEAIRSVHDDEKHLIPDSILFVSLEPCCITGKTPPCTDLILHEGIRNVRYSATDPNPAIAGRSKTLLEQKGIHVISGILEEEGLELIKPFRINITEQRPYIILKWAQSKYGFMGKTDERVLLSHAYTNAWTHQQRASVDAIMVGARTVMTDDPFLTTRDAPGSSPVRVVFDYNANLTMQYNAFNDDGRRIFYFSLKEN
ncbi:MAG: bifunctional diaminohydroxyphosphoribosylaminopyrimidine deaminase/5-amino-6-(5-phosphoribosylamino)uracil reductase RibD, partial [Saprospiraceae bacterium]